MSNRDSLEKYIRKNLKDRSFYIVTNREPYIHNKTFEGIEVTRPSGGAHTLLELIARVSQGTYIAHGAGSADKQVVDKNNCIKMPPKEKLFTLKRVFLSKKELEYFYYGFTNQTLWPLCHAVFVKPEFNPLWWESYKEVNRKFAQTVLDDVGDKKAFVWVNDYHFCLLPQMLRESGKDIKIGTFWHIPWPTYEIFRVNPWAKELLIGLLGSDLLAFHRGYQAQNFVQSVQRELEAKIGHEQSKIVYKEHLTKIENLEAGIDYQEIVDLNNKGKTIRRSFMTKLFGMDIPFLILGVDRLDYTKGIIERLKMIDRFFEKHPEYIEKVVYYGIMPQSRFHIPAYRAYAKNVTDLAEKINWKYSTGRWVPIHYTLNGLSGRDKVFQYYKQANVCLVTSLDDGMNLVAKEYVIACDAEKGSLVLSKFTGASNDLRYSTLINPYNIEEGADAIFKALNMDPKDRKIRNLKMRKELKERNIYNWAIRFIEKTLYE
ncbi:trehalose-6-phosphate synthase [Candidatus Roizmanbacteria bacterium CG_4_10_14_0_8_um_filter_39_9]|uniref:Trehalose-6-phosphate synthase n=1 Tax=Candidatus Roizmanbacteria bacterium CG_4_10_14_0_8_um_filter_39_9 TaxID=1974829 RepID=A0A2M7QCX6_9BACT|nr:MAG: trehalose-6-phosphate synthase [Candidatus Roizmanbacteria bacterium CG_4_10_14_0_8_um_filter_39_9]